MQNGGEQATTQGERPPLPELFTPEEWKALAAKLRLTPRQTEVARLICLGLSKQQMADKLHVSEGTARLHVKELFKRLEVNDRVGVPIRLVLASRDMQSGKAQPYPNG